MWINFKLFYAPRHEVNTPAVARDQQPGSVSSLNERRSSSASCHISGGLWRGGCWEMRGREEGDHSCRATADQPQWVSWRCQRERQRSQPLRLWHRLQEAHLHQHPAQGRERDNRDKEYLQHTALIKERGQTKTCVRVILPQLMAVCVHTEKCLQMGGKTLDGENCYNAQPLVAYCSNTQCYIYSGFSQCTLFQAAFCKKRK